MSAARKRPYFRLHTGYVALAEAHSTSVRPSGPSASLSRPRRCPARSLSARIRWGLRRWRPQRWCLASDLG